MSAPEVTTHAFTAPGFIAGASLVQDIAVLLLAAAAAGMLCKRLGLSVIVGYLIAGVVIGPNTPLPLIGDAHRIEELSELGLVFVMFSIGLHLSLTKLMKMGIRSAAATAFGAFFMLQFTVILGGFLDWNTKQSLFVASMLMVSSSAVISKVMEELRLGHDRIAQMALGMTILEDIVAVIMLTLLASNPAAGEHAGEHAGLGMLVTRMGSFVVLLVGAGLLFVPKLFRRFEAKGDPELRTILIAGLLLFLSFCAVRAGYSLALGAFLFGAIVAELPQRETIEKNFGSLRSVFSSVFFVSIGMMIKPSQLAEPHTLALTAGLTLFSLFVRPLACGLALMLVGVPPKDARRGGLLLAPLGEFTFIIAQAGIAAAILPENFQPIAVALSIFTVLATPFLNRYSEPILGFVERVEPGWFKRGVAAYQLWLGQLGASKTPKPALRIIRRKLTGVAVEALLVSGLLIFSRPLYAGIRGEFAAPGDTRWFVENFDFAFWGVIVLICLVPLTAMWRALSAIAMIVAESAEKPAVPRRLIATGVRLGSAIVMAYWLYALTPVKALPVWGWPALGVAAAAVVVVFSGRLVFWHSEIRTTVHDVLSTGSGAHGESNEEARARVRAEMHEGLGSWAMTIGEAVVPDDAAYAGRSLHELALPAEYGCSVLEIERNGHGILSPDSKTMLYPGDRLLLLGSDKDLARSREFLENARASSLRPVTFGEAVLGACVVPETASAQRSLAELQVSRQSGVRIVGIRRTDAEKLNPTGTERLLPGDRLLLVGTPDRLAAFPAWLAAQA